MGTTTNYGWPTPVSTDYVTDGWDAIKDLGDAIDTSLALVRVPTGAVLPFAGDGTNAPGGFLYARGQTVSRTTYAALFAVLGTTYGVGDGSTTFGLPNLQTRIPVGLDKSGTPDTAFDTIGETGGSKDAVAAHTHGVGTYTASTTGSATSGGSHSHTQSDTADLEQHTHGLSGRQTTSTSHTHTGTSTVAMGITGGTSVTFNTDLPDRSLTTTIDSGGAHTHTLSATTTLSGSSASSGTSGGNLQPYITLNYIIKT